MVYLELVIDDLKVDGISPTNGGFELGDISNWEIDSSDDFSLSVTSDSYSGNYAGNIICESYKEYDFIFISYNNSTLSGSSSVSLMFKVPYYYSIEPDAIVMLFYIYTEDDEYFEYLYTFDSNQDSIPLDEWINVSADISSFNGTPFSLGISIYLYGSEPPGELILYIDDIITHKSTWEEFLNGDFESGLDNWFTSGNVSIDNTIVHGGNNSCKLSGDYSYIRQYIDLTNYKQLSIYYNITQCNDTVTFELLSGSTPVKSWTVNSTTNGWFKLRFDVDGLDDIYTLKISSIASTVYIDDITPQEEYEVQPCFINFNNSTWFHYIIKDGSISSILNNEGINNSRCVYLYPKFWVGHANKSGIYYYVDLTNIQLLQFWFKAPIFDIKQYYYNYGKLNVKVNDTIFNIANATYGGSIPEWTHAIVDVSVFSGICKIEIYGEIYDYGYVDPIIEIYIDNVYFSPFPINISHQLYLRNQYDYEMRALDNGMLIDNNLQYSHRLTDKGQFINFDYEDINTKGFVRSIKHILNTLYMRIRGIV